MSQTTINATSFAAAMKELYTGQAVETLTYQNHPFWAMLPKKTDFEGTLKPLPVRISPSAGVSYTFANAQANAASATYKRFALTRAALYGVSVLDRQTMLATAGDAGAFIAAAKENIDATMEGVMNILCADLFRSGTGSVGKIGSIDGSGLITLTNPQDVVNFENDQKLQVAATDGGTPRVAAGYVVAVDRSAGTVTVSTSLGGGAASPSAWQAADFVLHDGNSNATIKGLAAWVPLTTPAGNDSFFGLNRSIDPTRLAGVRYADVGQSIEEALVDSTSLLQREGGKPDVCFMGPASFANLAKSLGTRLQYVDVKSADISFQGINLATPAGNVKVMSDPSCPVKLAYLLSMNTWAYSSLGPSVAVQSDHVTDSMLRSGSADALELRISSYGQLECKAPGRNAVVGLGA